MILVDTSVWIRFLANRAPYAAELDALLSRDEVVGHEFVYGELLIGDRGGRKKLLALYEQMRQASMAPHRDVVAFVRSRDLRGRGVGWIDIHLLASAILRRSQLCTANSKLRAVTKDGANAYEATGCTLYA